MPRLYRRVFLAVAVLLGPCPGVAVAADKAAASSPAVWSAELGVGVDYDSNISVQEVDVTSNQSDYAMTLDVGLAVKKQLSETVKAGLTYD